VPQAVLVVCGAGGGAPWQALHPVMASVHFGAVSVPPAVPPVSPITAPWHQVALQLPAVAPELAVQVPFWRFALAAPVNPTSVTPFA